jgi:Calcineurin-like phosphoesterase
LRTLVVSDLHLGTRKRVDVLRVQALRDALLAEVAVADRVVLLGDVLELRDGPLRETLPLARPFFEALGEAVGDGQVVLVPGNHDHALIAPWFEHRGVDVPEPPLEIEQLIPPHDAAPAVELIGRWLGGERLVVAYPGLWLRDDVYATHGHYLDAHLTVPTFERLAIGVTGRVVRRPAKLAATVEDYESMLGPMYAWIHAVARHAPSGAATFDGGGTIRAWRALAGPGPTSPRMRMLKAAFPLGIGTLNRLGIGPLNADLSAPELRRAGLRAMGEVVSRLRIDAAHVIFGHTHRTGPLPRDELHEWRAPNGARLHNSGSWVYETTFMTRRAGESPYWPGGCLVLDDEGAPRLLRLLSDRAHDELELAVAA